MALRSLHRALRFPTASSVRSISSKLNREHREKPAPYPHETKDFTVFAQWFDYTTPRFDENTRVIVVDGAHAVGKTELAKQLAEEFEMKHFDHPRVESIFTDSYGVDLRQYSEFFTPYNVPYDEKDFARDPTGPVQGAGDRFLWKSIIEKYRNYMYALKHLFSTGQGVVVEGSPFSDYAHFDAAYNQGWISRTTRDLYKEALRLSLRQLLRPNVIVYLDAPVDKVIKKIADRGNEWDKGSPVWTNKRYLTDIYTEMKRRFLKEQLRFSYVLVYDWSEPGDTEVVFEDIEDLELDFLEQYSELQQDWKRIRDESGRLEMRYNFCRQGRRNTMLNIMATPYEFYLAEQLWMSVEDVNNFRGVFDWVPSQRFGPGFNKEMGDKGFFWKSPFKFQQIERQIRSFHIRGVPRE